MSIEFSPPAPDRTQFGDHRREALDRRDRHLRAFVRRACSAVGAFLASCLVPWLAIIAWVIAVGWGIAAGISAFEAFFWQAASNVSIDDSQCRLGYPNPTIGGECCSPGWSVAIVAAVCRHLPGEGSAKRAGSAWDDIFAHEGDIQLALSSGTLLSVRGVREW